MSQNYRLAYLRREGAEDSPYINIFVSYELGGFVHSDFSPTFSEAWENAKSLMFGQSLYLYLCSMLMVHMCTPRCSQVSSKKPCALDRDTAFASGSILWMDAPASAEM